MSTHRTSTAAIDGYVPFPDERIQAYVDDGYWKNRAFHEIIDEPAASSPDQPAVVSHSRELTYSELAENTRAIAASLQGLGLEPDDTVAFQLPNCVEFCEAFFACSRLGVAPALLLPRHRRREVTHILRLTRAKAVVTVGTDTGGFDYAGMIDRIVDDHPALEHRIIVTDGHPPDGWLSFDALRTQGDPDTPTPMVNPNNPGLFMLSGGTSGLPKAIPRTHNDYLYSWEHVTNRLELTHEWTVTPGVSLAHSFGFGYMLGPAMWAGGCLAVEPTLKPRPLATAIDEFDADLTGLIPKQLIDLLEQDRKTSYDLGRLQLVGSGGQKVPPEIIRQVTDQWGVGFCHIYGMGEGIQITTSPSDPQWIHQETVGTPVGPGDEVRLLSPDGEPVQIGQRGELVVRGPGVFSGYLRNPEANRADFQEDGWFHTGDVFRERKDGFYEVYGRLDDTINRAGETIYATAIEDLLLEHPMIKTAGVVGIPDEALGERVGAVIELEGDAETLTLNDVVRFLEAQGAAVFNRPEELHIVDALPETSVGKINRPELRERFTEA